jgi:hypothetical protein
MLAVTWNRGLLGDAAERCLGLLGPVEERAALALVTAVRTRHVARVACVPHGGEQLFERIGSFFA